MLYNIVVGPIEYVVGWIFMFIVNKFSSFGVIGAICGVSVCINILALPLYNIAESIQEKERQINKKMEPRVKRIKKGFKGDEQFMILSEYYRQNNYHPLYALRGSLSILIEIPFFIAAYNYLSASEILKEASFWIFSNLGEADRMFTLTLGSLVIPVNILPILMTAINFVSGYIYTKNATTRDKIQLYALGLVFLVLLYNSPSGLVIYWILNNIFSLVKTIVLKTKHPGRFLHALMSATFIAVTFKLSGTNSRGKFFILALFTAVFTLFPFIILICRKAGLMDVIGRMNQSRKSIKSPFTVVLFSGLALAFLCGFLLPASTIATSAEEFSYLGSISDPRSYVWSTLWLFVGFFVFWPCGIYKMFGDRVKRAEAAVLFTILVVALFDAFVFKGEYGKLTTQFYTEDPNTLDNITLFYKIGPVITTFISLVLYAVFDYYGKTGILSLLCLSVTIGEIGLGTAKMNKIGKSYRDYTRLIEEKRQSTADDEFDKIYHLSRTGKNVVVLFLDRAVSTFLPYTLEQVDGLKEQLNGFVYYPNTVSFGGNTTFAYPSMAGGYEYTPEKFNERDELLVKTHNEASLVAPKLFSDAGYSVTVTDPAFPNYSTRGDLSAYESIEGIKVDELYGRYLEKYYKELNIEGAGGDVSLLTKEGSVNFSVLQVLPPILRYTFEVACRKVDNQVYRVFISSLSSLYFLDDLTTIEEKGNTYTFIGNEATHQPINLSSSLLYEATEKDTFVSEYPVDDDLLIKHYTTFSSTLKQIGRWMDWLRENGIYDNTRIIVVSDHGYGLNTGVVTADQSQYLPLLLVKDFNSNGEFRTDYTFMTNADTIFLSTAGLEEVSDINPFTGIKLTAEKDGGINAYPIVDSREWNAPVIIDYTKFTLDKNVAWHIYDNIFDPSNWVNLSQWEEMNK